jgi:hypothetical protein
MFIGLVQGQGRDYNVRLPFTVAFVEGQTGRPSAATAPAPAAVPAPTPAPRAAAPAAPTIPANTVTGTATYNGQKLTVSRGLAWLKASDNQVELALFDRAPRAGILAELRSGTWGEGGPIVTMSLRITRGAPMTPAAVTYCYVNVDFPKGGPMGTGTNNAAGCGLTVLDGDGKAGGTIAARLKSQAMGPGDRPFTWDLQFNLPVAK